MRCFAFLLMFFSYVFVSAHSFTTEEIARWEAQAKTVTITRDNWGIPHIYGKTDADVVFGLMYAQCEDDFDRVEMNYLDAIGRLAEVQGESALYHDLRARMFLDTTQAMTIYKQSPKWLQKLLNAFADGTNYFLYKNPDVKPALLTRFQPWMPLMFSEGSIGGNITVISLNRMQAFYENQKFGVTMPDALRRMEAEPTGSNGFAIAPAKSATGNALLLINPHTSFYFRTEAQMVSEEGLNAYGALTWGQFFIYQGFNENCGWMHTSSYSDFLDEYLETVEKRGNRYFYKYGDEWRAVQEEKVVLPYKNGNGVATKEFTIYRTHHGPVIGERDGQWITIRMMNEPLKALKQSYLRTKAKDYRSYLKTMKLNGNASNNTVFADGKGNIAYWHGNFIPERNPGFDYSGYVDGSNPNADWLGLHKVKDIVQLRNPASGWIQNCNSTPFTAAGASSPNEEDYPDYMAPDGENYRGINAVRVLSRETSFTLDKLISAAYDPYLSRFAALLPPLIKAYDKTGSDSRKVAEAMEILRAWDYNCGEGSIATTLAIYWGEGLQRLARTRLPAGVRLDAIAFTDFMIENTSDEEKVNMLLLTLDRLEQDFGSWRTPWGDVNRFQRLTGEIQETFDDDQPSLPVGFASSAWGSLASFGAGMFDTKKRYGTGGNSFVAVVEFGDRVRAKAVVTGGQSSDPDSPHFYDQAKLYTTGTFRDVLFYPEEVSRNAERTYNPGQE